MSLWLKCYLCVSHEVTETFSRSRKYSIYIMWNWKSSCWNSWWYQKCINCVIVSSLQLSSLHPLLLSNTTFYSSALSEVNIPSTSLHTAACFLRDLFHCFLIYLPLVLRVSFSPLALSLYSDFLSVVESAFLHILYLGTQLQAQSYLY